MANRNGNRAFQNAAFQMQFEDTGIKTERKAEKDLGGVTDVSVNQNDRFQKKETNTAGPDSEDVYESSTNIQQGKPLFRCMVYLMSSLLVLIFLTAVVNLTLNLSQLNLSSGCRSTEVSVTPVHSQGIKAEDSDMNNPSSATHPRQFSELRKQVEKMKESILDEVKQQTDAIANLTTLVSKKDTGPSCPPSKNGLKGAIETLEMMLKNLTALVNEICPRKPQVASSCKELYERNHSLTSDVYKLLFGSQEIPVYCHMGNFGCGDGGWTPAMKINGSKNTFNYNSRLWSNKEIFNLTGGKTGFDREETKLPTYWTTPFSKICLGMRIDQQINFVAVNKEASSLYSLIADGQYRGTSLGRSTWKSLIGSAGSLQQYCNKEGFNAVCTGDTSARIGILGNEINHCNGCDSRIGFGNGGYPDDSNTCGNDATWSPDNGVKHIKAMGYILVQ